MLLLRRRSTIPRRRRGVILVLCASGIHGWIVRAARCVRVRVAAHLRRVWWVMRMSMRRTGRRRRTMMVIMTRQRRRYTMWRSLWIPHPSTTTTTVLWRSVMPMRRSHPHPSLFLHHLHHLAFRARLQRRSYSLLLWIGSHGKRSCMRTGRHHHLLLLLLLLTARRRFTFSFLLCARLRSGALPRRCQLARSPHMRTCTWSLPRAWSSEMIHRRCSRNSCCLIHASGSRASMPAASTDDTPPRLFLCAPRRCLPLCFLRNRTAPLTSSQVGSDRRAALHRFALSFSVAIAVARAFGGSRSART